MNYGELKTQWERRLGVTDLNDQILPGLINSALEGIANAERLEFYKAYAQISTRASLSTGTVSVAQDSAAITFSSAPSASLAGQLIVFGSDSTIYFIDSHTAASDSATLSTTYIGTTDTVATYVAYVWQYSLPSDFDRSSLKKLSLQDPDSPIEVISEDLFRQAYPNLRVRTGNPEVAFEVGDGVLQLWPLPTERKVLDVTYYRRPTLMALTGVTSSDTIDFPTQYHDIVLYHSLMNHAANIRDSVVAFWKQMYDSGIRHLHLRHAAKISRTLRSRPWQARGSRSRSPRVELD